MPRAVASSHWSMISPAVIAGGVPGARLELVDRAAHLATVERADVCTPLLLEHLGGA